VRRVAFPIVVAMSLLAGGCALLDQTQPDKTADVKAECAPSAGPAEDEGIATDWGSALRRKPVPAECRALCENMAAAKVRAAKAVCAMPVTESDNLLVYFGRVQKLGGAELANEHESARQSFSRSRTDSNRMRYAMLLSMPGTPFSNETRALETLRPLVNNAASSLHPLAVLMNTQIETQRRERELSQKLDALKTLDKSLIERGLY
jgi:hypothetical protein